MRQKQEKNQWNCFEFQSNKLNKSSYFCIIFKSIFQQKAYTCRPNCLSDSNTNHFFSFHLCRVGNSLTYSVQLY